MSWVNTSVAEMITFQRGFDLPRDKFIDGNVPVVGSTGIIGYHNKVKVKSPGVVTGRSGTLGVIQFIIEDYWPHNTTLWIKDFKGHDSKFIYYLLQTIDFKSLNAGVAVPTLNRNILANVQIGYPNELPTQKKIASILSAYDDLIENNLKRIKLLEEAAQNIYREWFVHFRYPGHEDAPINKETGLPQGWERKSLGDVAILNYGKSLKKDDRASFGNVPVYGSSGIIGFHNKPLINDAGIILGRKGTRGSVYYCSRPFYPIDTVYYVTSNMPLFYILYFLKNQVWLNSDAAVPGLNRNYAYSKLIILPTNYILQKFEAMIGQFHSQITALLEINQKLKEARDILLPRLMNQTIEV